ncbi:MAG: hypothetical protein ACYDH1_01515 [Anaerolineaceae bacterium]
MIVDLNSLLIAVRTYLMDGDSLVWSVEALEQGIRLALDDLQKVCPIKLSIEGLDEAVTTSLGEGMFGLLVRGAVVFALDMRIVDRADQFELSQTGLDMSGWVQQLKHDYWTDVEKLRRFYMNTSADVPYFTIPDPDGV